LSAQQEKLNPNWISKWEAGIFGTVTRLRAGKPRSSGLISGRARHRLNLGEGCKGWQMPLKYFFLTKNRFLATELRRGKYKKFKYFLNDYFFSVKT
jgi:hypothetical protein